MATIRSAAWRVAITTLALAAACNSIIGAGEATVASAATGGSAASSAAGGGGSGGPGAAGGGTGGDTSGAGGTSGNGGAAGLGGASSNGGAVGLGGASGAGGTSGVYARSDAGAFVPTNARSCAQSGGVDLLCNGESCCTTINVPGGAFTQGGSPAIEPNAHVSTVSAFALDRYEVTVGRFRNFVTAYIAGWRPSVGSGKAPNVTVADTSWQAGWDDSNDPTGVNLPMPGLFTSTSHLKCDSTKATWTDSPGANENLPVNCVKWYEAFAFCVWDGGRLPTESEWEHAAAGGSENRPYPWGSTAPDCTYANFSSNYKEGICTGGGSGFVVAVGSTPLGDGKWGHADLAGNVREWVFDSFGPYSASASNNYANTASTTYRAARSSCWFSNDPPDLRAAHRDYYSANWTETSVGFRCARAVQGGP